MTLELADQVASVTSAVLGAAGLVCALVGLVLQRRDRERAPADPYAAPTAPPPLAGPDAGGGGLYVPERGEWVPDPSHLPPYGGTWGSTPDHLQPSASEDVPPTTGRTLLVVGASLLGLCAVAALVGLAL
ncbi:hypothetical protein [Saccharothrix yanglingensis]|uniref:Uncharacterized protein n=1 Tax=Saccharothrix yanglingensis TaxID=659496 RepID=A0ABU0X1J3_9PSEU|nr:hypothetical protein [Saccharothrix yanglingensis]MDQ2585867.1 hypothetical protein [Saccharothrix yanglingensis]